MASVNNNAMTPYERFMALMLQERSDILLVYFYAIFSGLVNLTLPLGIQAMMSILFGGQASSSWVILLSLVIIGLAIGGVLQIVQISIMERLQQRLMVRVSTDLAFRTPRWKVEAILKKHAPEQMNRFFDILTVQKGLSKIIVDFSAAILQVIFGLILLAFYHAYFAIFGILMFIIFIIIFKLSFGAGLDTSLKESKQKYRIAEWLQELARVMNIVKLAGYTDIHTKKTDELAGEYVKARKSHFRVLEFQYALIVAFRTLVIGGVLVIGSLLVIDEQINIGQFVASEIMIILILNSVEKIMSSIDVVYDVFTAVEKIGQVLDIEIENEDGLTFNHIQADRGIEMMFENVSYKFPGDDRYTLNNINLKIEAGEKICLAGYPGSGRSIFISLMASMLHNYQGTIAFNGTTLKNLNLLSLRSYVGENLAKKELIHGTIMENISMGRDDISFADIQKAVEAAGLTRYIQTTEAGYDTIIVPEDLKIPSSIAVKIAMARSFAESPSLFVLDDFLHKLSKEDKQLITKSLTGDLPWTLIGSSNDPIFASQCDRVIVMKGGEIMDIGSFEEIHQKPYYSEVFTA